MYVMRAVSSPLSNLGRKSGGYAFGGSRVNHPRPGVRYSYTTIVEVVVEVVPVAQINRTVHLMKCYRRTRKINLPRAAQQKQEARAARRAAPTLTPTPALAAFGRRTSVRTSWCCAHCYCSLVYHRSSWTDAGHTHIMLRDTTH